MLRIESQNERVNYLLHGLKQDLFPCNYGDDNERWTWGISTVIYSKDTISQDAFFFNSTLQREIAKAIKFSQALEDDYGDAGPPQLILNYVNNCFVLTIECYDRDASIHDVQLKLSEAVTIMYIEATLREGKQFRDLLCKFATYESK